MFFLSDGTRIDDNEYLSSLENDTKLTVCTEEQIQKLLIYFELRLISLKNMSHPLNIDILYNCFFKITFIEAVLSSNKSCSKCFLIVFTYDFEVTRVRNE